MATKVLSVGGSIIAPNEPDENFLLEFSKMASEWLEANKDSRLILVAGGGAPARVYQNAYRAVAQKFSAEQSKACSFENADSTIGKIVFLSVFFIKYKFSTAKHACIDITYRVHRKIAKNFLIACYPLSLLWLWFVLLLLPNRQY